MKKVLSFVIKNDYINARKIADYIVIALIKYPSKYSNPTYASVVKRTKWDWIPNTKSGNEITDTDICYYKITIYKLKGNRGSILSPAQNPIYDNVIAVNNMEEIINKLENHNS